MSTSGVNKTKRKDFTAGFGAALGINNENTVTETPAEEAKKPDITGISAPETVKTAENENIPETVNNNKPEADPVPSEQGSAGDLVDELFGNKKKKIPGHQKCVYFSDENYKFITEKCEKNHLNYSEVLNLIIDTFRKN